MGMMTRRNVKRRAVEKTAPVVTTDEKVADIVEDKNSLTKTDINRMFTSDLRELAVAKGIDNADEYTGAELKKILIDKLGL